MRLVHKCRGWFADRDRVRAALLSFALLVMILLTAWSTLSTWQETGDARHGLLIFGLVAAGVTQLVYCAVWRPARMRQEVARQTEARAITMQRLEAEIVERRQAEADLRRSEARLRAIIMGAADGIITFDQTGAILDCNPSACRILTGGSRGIEGECLWDILPHAQHAAFAAQLAQLDARDAETPVPLIFDARGIGGADVDVTIALGRAPALNGWMYTAVLRDVTTTRRAEAMLRAAHDRLYKVISNAPVVVFAVDAEGIFTLSEGSGLAKIGREPGEVVGRSIFDVYPDRPEISQAIRAALTGLPQTRELQFPRVVYDVSYLPIWDGDGRVTGVMGVAHDVTRRKQAEDALTSVLDTVGDSVIVADEDGEIVMANRQVEDVFGYWPDELVGRNILELAAPHLVAAGEVGMARFQVSGEGPVFNRRLQMEGLHRSGRIFPVEVFVGKTQIGGLPHFTASIRDVTQDRDLEKLRDEFLSTVSHELRTPLASIMGWLETVLEGRPGTLNDTQTRFLSIAYASAERLNRLVEEISTASRLERGPLHLEKAPFDPSEALSAAVDMLDGIAAERDIAIIINDNWPQQATLDGDRGRLDQVLANLLSNAVKFSPNGAVVEVRSDLVDGTWRLEVADHGIGIPRDEVHRLFQRFFRRVERHPRPDSRHGTGTIYLPTVGRKP